MEAKGENELPGTRTSGSIAEAESQKSSSAESGSAAQDGAMGPSGAAGARGIHTVEEGEHLSAIASKERFFDFATVWNAPGNAGLRQVRDDPHQLLPGDDVVIPAKHPKDFVRATGQSHPFTAHVEKLKLRLVLRDITGQPMAGRAGKLIVDGAEQQITTDGDGLFEAPVPRGCQKGRVDIDGYTFDLAIGALAPFSERRGQADRLMNLGYWRGSSDDPYDLDARTLAIELFQDDKDLAPTGEADTDLLDQLSQEHDNRSRQVLPPAQSDPPPAKTTPSTPALSSENS
jgi:hypothetical protein